MLKFGLRNDHFSQDDRTAAPLFADAILTPLEKILLLKSVPLLLPVPDDVLEKMAALFEEDALNAGTPIFTAGERGRFMYIVIAGRARIHDAQRTIGYLGSRATLGELALLENLPPNVSVTADTEMRLFRIEQSVFYEFMAEQPALARGLILSLRLRNRELLRLYKKPANIDLRPDKP